MLRKNMINNNCSTNSSNSTIVTKTLDILGKQDSDTMLGHFSEKNYTPWMMLISTILSTRSRDEVTEVLCKELFEQYPNAYALASAKQKEVEKLIKRIGFYHNKAKNIIEASKQVIHEFDGRIPDTFEELMQLPGVGRKVAGCVLVYAFHKDAIPTDTHVHRLSNRLGWVKTKTPEQTEQELMKIVPKTYWQMVNEHLVSHGKNVCKPITPLCSACCIERQCKKVGLTNKINKQKI